MALTYWQMPGLIGRKWKYRKKMSLFRLFPGALPFNKWALVGARPFYSSTDQSG